MPTYGAAMFWKISPVSWGTELVIYHAKDNKDAKKRAESILEHNGGGTLEQIVRLTRVTRKPVEVLYTQYGEGREPESKTVEEYFGR